MDVNDMKIKKLLRDVAKPFAVVEQYERDLAALTRDAENRKRANAKKATK